MIETIGGVRMDDSSYPGEDYYSDGDVEERLLSMVQHGTNEENVKAAEREKNWALYYHLSPIRKNIISWYPIEKESKVLEIGSGCGAVTGVLADKAKAVDCIELSKRRSTINAWQNKDRDNISILLGNFETIEARLNERYDYITLIGVLEYGASYISSERPYEVFLEKIRQHLQPGGKLLIAIENKMGLKYWAGAREDHVGSFFEGLEGYPETAHVRTFSKKELTELLHKCGFLHTKFYYPYPDYKFPLRIYSDEQLPVEGELSLNGCNMDRDRMQLFDEARVWDQTIRDGLFPYFSNSFFVEAAAEEESGQRKTVIVPQLNNDEQAEWVSMQRMRMGAIRVDDLVTRANVRVDDRKPFVRRALSKVKRKLAGDSDL